MVSGSLSRAQVLGTPQQQDTGLIGNVQLLYLDSGFAPGSGVFLLKLPNIVSWVSANRRNSAGNRLVKSDGK